MRVAPSTNLGALAAVPLLLSLLALVAFIYAGQMAISAARHRQVATEQAEIDQVDERRAANRARLEALEEEERRLRTRLAELAALEQRVDDARRSRTELEGGLRNLRAEIAAAQVNVAGVARELDAKEQVPATQLVPSGTRRPAVFVECDDSGVLIMPERRRLAALPTSEDRDVFLARARATGYAVFLIRPAGVDAFDAYRRVLEEYNVTAAARIDLGFEPVNADWKIAYPDGMEGEV